MIDDRDPFPFYIGFDPREADAYDICRRTLVRHSTVPLHIVKLDRNQLAWPPDKHALYTRTWHWSDAEPPQRVDDIDGRPFSTEFTFTRFLVPLLQQYSGWAAFCDCDFLWLQDVNKLLGFADPRYAVMVVKHNQEVFEAMKMDGVANSTYPRKNWSSLILWNCGHPANRKLTRWAANNESGRWLHGFQWLASHEIGALPMEWNWLAGILPTVDPRGLGAVHYTLGVPSMAGHENGPYADLWKHEAQRGRIHVAV